MVISMTISYAHFTSDVQSSGSRVWFKVCCDVKQRLVIKGKFQASSGSVWQYFECANALHRGISSVIRGKLSEDFVFCINYVVSPSLVFSICVPWSLVQFGHSPASSPSLFGFSVSSPLFVKMKRQGKWNRSGGCQGS